jgi:hypothetical protein
MGTFLGYYTENRCLFFFFLVYNYTFFLLLLLLLLLVASCISMVWDGINYTPFLSCLLCVCVFPPQLGCHVVVFAVVLLLCEDGMEC